MLDVAAAVVDAENRAPRQGDSDDGRALVLGISREQQVGELAGVGPGGVRRTGLVASDRRQTRSASWWRRWPEIMLNWGGRPGAPATSTTPVSPSCAALRERRARDLVPV